MKTSSISRSYGLLAVLALTVFVSTGIAHADALNRQLQLGMSGSDVGVLQTYLATDVTIYPQGLVTNYFGFLTKAAVANFQSRNGLPAVGRVGPATLPVINAKIAGGVVPNTSSAPIISNIGINVSNNSTTVSWATNEYAQGVVYYSTTPLTTYENPNSVTVSGLTAMTDSTFRTGQAVTIGGLQANTTYYYMIYTTDQQGNVSVTVPSLFHTLN